MRKAICGVFCAMAVAAALWGCGSGVDTRENSGMTEADAQGSGVESAEGQESDSMAGVDALTDAAGQDGAAVQSGDGTGVDDAAAESGNDSMESADAVGLAGTSFSVLGDSISTFQGYNPVGYSVYFPEYGEVAHVEDTWWQRVADDLELTLYANGSSAGATVAGDSTETDNPQCGCNELRTNDLSGPEGACPDRVVIFMGANDMLQAVPLGDNDGTGLVEEGEVKTFSDAYTLMLDKVQANYPLAEIYCCTLPPMGDYGTDTPYVEFVNSRQLTSGDYGEVITRIAGNRGLPVIELYHCGITVENLHEMTTDGVHPTTPGMECIAEAVKEALCK